MTSEEKDANERWEGMPVAETAAPEGEDDIEFDASIDIDYIKKLSIMCVKTCKVCMRLSTEVNPFTRGHTARGFGRPPLKGDLDAGAAGAHRPVAAHGPARHPTAACRGYVQPGPARCCRYVGTTS